MSTGAGLLAAMAFGGGFGGGFGGVALLRFRCRAFFALLPKQAPFQVLDPGIL
jgi:hypothetical protein